MTQHTVQYLSHNIQYFPSSHPSFPHFIPRNRSFCSLALNKAVAEPSAIRSNTSAPWVLLQIAWLSRQNILIKDHSHCISLHLLGRNSHESCRTFLCQAEGPATKQASEKSLPSMSQRWRKYCLDKSPGFQAAAPSGSERNQAVAAGGLCCAGCLRAWAALGLPRHFLRESPCREAAHPGRCWVLEGCSSALWHSSHHGSVPGCATAALHATHPLHIPSTVLGNVHSDTRAQGFLSFQLCPGTHSQPLQVNNWGFASRENVFLINFKKINSKPVQCQ